MEGITPAARGGEEKEEGGGEEGGEAADDPICVAWIWVRTCAKVDPVSDASDCCKRRSSEAISGSRFPLRVKAEERADTRSVDVVEDEDEEEEEEAGGCSCAGGTSEAGAERVVDPVSPAKDTARFLRTREGEDARVVIEGVFADSSVAIRICIDSII